MEGVKLRFPGRQSDRALGVGVHGIVRSEGDGLDVVEDTPAPVRLCVDRRGVWLTIDGDGHGVHVNGRQVRRMAMLRVGDAVYVDGVEMRLVGVQPPQAPPPGLVNGGGEGTADPRVVLRGVGGRYHGRSFTLERPRLVGRNASADIRIDDAAFSDRHARLELVGDQVLLRDLGSSEGSVVNGEPVRDALLGAGDQVVFDGHHRFVVEAPRRVLPQLPDLDADADPEADAAGSDPGGRAHAWRLPWLLLAALLLAVLLAALLLFGPA
jgi:hypothetical protein